MDCYVCRVTREHREQLAKNTKTLNEKTKAKLKSIQNKYIKEATKQKDDVSSDLLHHVQEHVSSLGNNGLFRLVVSFCDCECEHT